MFEYILFLYARIHKKKFTGLEAECFIIEGIIESTKKGKVLLTLPYLI